MMRMRRWGSRRALLWGLSAMIASCHTAPEPVDVEPPDPVDVVVTAAWRAGADRSFSGRIESVDRADVATRVSGIVRSIPVDVGDRVRTGDVVLTLDDRDLVARIQAAEATVELADQSWGRVSRLEAEGAAARQELDAATAALAQARAALVEARAQAAYARVRAPFDGVVTQRSVDVGDLAVPGRALLRLQSVEQVFVAADLPADAIGAVEVGDTVAVEGVDLAERAVVSRVVPVLDPGVSRFRIEAGFTGEGRSPAGTVVSVRVPGAGGGARWIPEDAVIRRGQLAGAFTVERDTVRLRWLRLGRRSAAGVEVLAGPIGDLLVVRRPAADLRDGAPVRRQSAEGLPDEG